MFEHFSNIFVADKVSEHTGVELSPTPSGDQTVIELFRRFGGMSFNKGLYRILDARSASYWSATIATAFPELKSHVECFAFDWLGRAFVLDSRRLIGNARSVLMCEPGTGQMLEVPCDLVSFHEEELCEYRDAALAEDFFQQWLQAGGREPANTECVGYKRPLFLGGSDTLDNLEVTDIEEYWTIFSQLIVKLRGVPPGTSVKFTGDKP